VIFHETKVTKCILDPCCHLVAETGSWFILVNRGIKKVVRALFIRLKVSLPIISKLKILANVLFGRKNICQTYIFSFCYIPKWACTVVHCRSVKYILCSKQVCLSKPVCFSKLVCLSKLVCFVQTNVFVHSKLVCLSKLVFVTNSTTKPIHFLYILLSNIL